MIWLTWRQLRKQVLYAGIGLMALAGLMLPTGIAMHNALNRSGLASCIAKVGTAQVIPSLGQDCSALRQQFSDQYKSMSSIGILFVVLPVFVGLFFGAPLVAREVEHGTHRLVWTQGISRRRWAWTKFGIIGAVTAVFAVVYAMGVSWWYSPLLQAGDGRFGPVVFDVQGIAPIGYTVFAVALGIFAGTLSRRLLPAMGITLGGFFAVRVLIEALARPRFMAPETLSIAVVSASQPNPFAGDWVYSRGVINALGRLVMPNSVMGCEIPPGGGQAPQECGSDLVQQGLGPAPFYNWMQFQPDSRFWAFQGIEFGIFAVLAALLFYLAVRWIRRIS
jgi:hypothetical protein